MDARTSKFHSGVTTPPARPTAQRPIGASGRAPRPRRPPSHRRQVAAGPLNERPRLGSSRSTLEDADECLSGGHERAKSAGHERAKDCHSHPGSREKGPPPGLPERRNPPLTSSASDRASSRRPGRSPEKPARNNQGAAAAAAPASAAKAASADRPSPRKAVGSRVAD